MLRKQVHMFKLSTCSKAFAKPIVCVRGKRKKVTLDDPEVGVKSPTWSDAVDVSVEVGVYR